MIIIKDTGAGCTITTMANASDFEIYDASSNELKITGEDIGSIPSSNPKYWSIENSTIVDGGIPSSVQLEIEKDNLKTQLAIDLGSITVTVDLGNGSKTFSITPDSKYKYETILKHLDPAETIGWTLSDGTYDTGVTKEEIEEALRLGEIAGIALENAYHLAKSQL